ncbi:MAG: hypothetical protein Q4P18_07120 [Methanobrevibacter sp.]|uniref:hypothetical protein n=1 Tax=Methanobrevibacter sp. TaxID=66852 RepID=UPI0026E00672|nr:hypothetical protein [Methanobrevibacter sp.]MDO5849288.1 hypothetical protein [Methanobrevibacter sp.]
MKIEVTVEEITELIRLVYTMKQRQYMECELNDDEAGKQIVQAQIFLCNDLLDCIQSKKEYDDIRESLIKMREIDNE